jgi:transposase InsO family protein
MHHGMPQFIVSGGDAKFMASFWKHLFWRVGMKLLFNTTFHPQTDGPIERVNGVLKTMLESIKKLG